MPSYAIRIRSVPEKFEFTEVFLKIILLFVAVVFPKQSINIPLLAPIETSWELSPRIIAAALVPLKTNLGSHPAPLVIVAVPTPKFAPSKSNAEPEVRVVEPDAYTTPLEV